MEPRRDDPDLAAELRALRPLPERAFAEAIDARAADGFPRRGRHPMVAVSRIGERLRTTPPRRLLAPVGAFAVIAVVIATAAVMTSENGQGTRPESGGGVSLTSRPPSHAAPNASSKSSSGAVEFEAAAVPRATGSGGPGPYASRAGHRDIERSAQVVLGANPTDVRTDATKVFNAVHVADGIVLSSSIRNGAAGEAGADFDLLIPSGKLGDALAAFSAIAEVRSRHESTQDITAPTIGLSERLQDSRAKIESLLSQLAGATTDAERAAVESELRAGRRRAVAIRSHLIELRRRASFSRVSLKIETGKGSTGGGAGGWGLDNGIHAATRVLAIAAGVTIVGLAILVPLALVFLLAALAYRTWLRRGREQALS